MLLNFLFLSGTTSGKASLSANSKQAPNGSKEQTEAIKTVPFLSSDMSHHARLIILSTRESLVSSSLLFFFFQFFLILIDILGSDSLSHSQSLSLCLCSQPQNKTQIFHSLLLPKRHSLFSYISPIFVASITVYTGACDVLTVYVLSFVYFRLVIFLLHCNNLLCLLLL